MNKLINNLIRTLYFYIYEKCMILPYYFFRIFPVKKGKIVFSNFEGKGYGDNPKYIAEEIIRQNFNCDLVWLVDSNTEMSLPHEIRVVNIRSLKAVFELVTAKIWVDNNRKSFVTRKRKNQFYIQTWHGCLMIKMIEKDAECKLPFLYVKSAINDSKLIDLCLSNSEFMTNFYKSSFWYSGEILRSGFPKSDPLINNNIGQCIKIKSSLNLKLDTNIVLYAPTFRNSKNIDIYNLNYQEIIDGLKLKFGDDWLVLVKLHPSMSGESDKMKFCSNVINVSNYNDIQDLMLISDVLITDYSSTMFEFSLLRRPVFLYAPDICDFVKERGLYFDFNELPFPVSENMKGLKEKIYDYNEITYNPNVNSFFDRMGITENGTASKTVVEIIKHQINAG